MQVTHELKARALCPVNGLADEYECAITVDRIVLVEELIDFLAEFELTTIYQEELTRLIANHFKATVKTVGKHSSVKTTCVIGSGNA